MRGNTMRYHTTDPAERAWHVANHEATEVLKRTGDPRLAEAVRSTTFENALRELAALSPERRGSWLLKSL